MLKIEITDAKAHSPAELRALADLFAVLAGDNPRSLGTVTVSMDGTELTRQLKEAADLVRQELKISDVDNPAAGVDAAAVFAGGGDPAIVFAGGADPAQVFAQGNGTGAAVAPSTAAVGPSLTAPGATPDTSTNQTGLQPPAPPPAPAAAIAAAPAPLTPNPAPGVDVDSTGLPWDGRIHAASKAKIQKDQTWKKRRGIDDATVVAVEAELRAVLAAPAPLGNVPPPPPAAPLPTAVTAAMLTPPAPPPPPAAIVTAPDTSTTSQVSAPAAAPPPPPPAAPGNAAPVAVTFPQLVPKVTLALANKSLSEARLKQILDHYGLPSIPSLVQRPDLVQPVHDALFVPAAA